MSKNMVEEMSLEEFRDSGMLWYVNQQLHLFGMALMVTIDDFGKVKDLRPVKCKFRGFSEEVNDRGYKNVTKYMVKNSKDLLKDCE